MLKPLVLSTLVLVLMAGSAHAQSASAAPATPTASAPAPASPGLSLDTPIEDIVAVPAARAVLDKDIPGLTSHPAYEQFKSMSLKEVQPMSDGALTDDMLTKTSADLAALPK